MVENEVPDAESNDLANVDLTQVQSEDAAEVSAKLSIPTHVRQHASAPKISGYVLTEALGEGAYGHVWRAWQMRTRKEVAVKVFNRRTGLDWIFLQREVERLTRLDRHPHIVTLLDINLEQEPPFYVMDLIEGGSLHQFVTRETHTSGDHGWRWATQICDALSYVHGKGLIHCDLKPANILVDGRDHIRVVDFGQSRVFTESAASMGTLFYMAPEQAVLAEPDKPVQPDIRWDVYALGASLYAILTGIVPYANRETVKHLETAPCLADRLDRYCEIIAAGPPPTWEGDLGNDVPPDLCAVIDKCLAQCADDRYENIGAVDADLRAIHERRPVSALAASKSYRARRFVQRNPFLVGLAGMAVVLAAVIAVAAIQRVRIDRANARDILASFVHDPKAAVAATASAGRRTKRFLKELTGRYLSSPAFTERIMGARSGPWVDPDAFWESTRRGPLWQNGEWLELARTSSQPQALCAFVESKIASGSAREKYAAFCLLGTMSNARCDLTARCASAAKTETHPGVSAAAWWAASQLGQTVQRVDAERVRVDEVTGLTFVSIPTTEDFRRGSDVDDRDRSPNEARLATGVEIGPIWVSATEVTLSAFSEFWKEHRRVARMDAGAKRAFSKQFAGVAPEEARHRAVGGVSLLTAHKYCEWLNIRAADRKLNRWYRLPTEDEWEYACRGGGTRRFCYGDDAKYAPYFAACNGEVEVQRVAERMPNFYGLFDMHGGLWELTDSRFPPELAPPELAKSELFVKRGGAFYNPAVRCRSAQRNVISPAGVDFYTGLRLVLVIEP